MHASATAPRNDFLILYRGDTANRAAGVGASACLVRNDGVTYSSYPFLEENDDQSVGRYVGSYTAYETGLFEVKNSSTATLISLLRTSTAYLRAYCPPRRSLLFILR